MTWDRLVLAYHGCDRSIINDVLIGKQDLRVSRNNYDWLGNGTYCWEDRSSYVCEIPTASLGTFFHASMKPATGESGKPKTEMGKAESRNSRFRVGGSPNFSFPLFFNQHPSTPVARNPAQKNPSRRQSRPCSRGSLTPVAAPNVSPNVF